MKLTVIGGGGVRTPLFVASALRRAEQTSLDELCLMDIHADRLATMDQLCQSVAQHMESSVKITTTADPRAALEGSDYVVTTIRVGNEAGRVLDERIALRHGVLGQETTGPGGFAMAMRSIPAILAYAEMIRKLAPQAWILNFSNPAGLVTQALRWSGFERTVGICDGANLAQQDVSKWLQVDPHRLAAEVFGLNHLSWTRRVWLDGEDVLPGLLRNPEFCATSSIKVFDQDLIQMLGLHLNEYLYYYYYAERALEQITQDRQTRGEEVLALNQKLFDTLSKPELRAHPEEALRAYIGYEKRRSATYMHYAQPDGPSMDQADQIDFGTLKVSPEEGEGYAGVALDIITALESGTPLRTALNIPNKGAIEGMLADDVVEVSCSIADGEICPVPIGATPPITAHLMGQVKNYERLAVEAILTRSRKLGIQALMEHPLVQSYSRSKTLLDEYLQAHAAYVGDWSA
jgi:6-phospho-beta-glucosidase